MRVTSAVEIRPAVNLEHLAKEVRAINVEIADGERLVTATAEKLADRRVRLGKKLIEARKAFSSRGDGFVKWVEDQGIDRATAHRYMASVGYIPESPGAGRKPDQCSNSNQSQGEIELPPSNIERLISEGIQPREAALQVVSDQSIDWMGELERLGESMRRSARSLFSSAEALDVLCRQHTAAISSPTVLTMHSMLVAAKTSIQKTLQLMGKE